MATEDPLVASLLAAVAASPDDVALRLHVARLLVDRGLPEMAVEHCAALLRRDPANAEAVAVLARATQALSASDPPASDPPAGDPPASDPNRHEAGDLLDRGGSASAGGFDWRAAEAQMGDLADAILRRETGHDLVEGVERPVVRLSDVGGMDEVKAALELALLGPLRQPEIAKAYGKTVGGGLLLYGPPGCGKTYLARAVAGEIGAHFYAVGLPDVLDMYLGQSERNLREIFRTARRNAPCVLFLDEIDALGHKRSNMGGNAAMRGTVNQLLAEMDGVGGRNDGVFVLAATNHPWDVDVALRRPGRLDRMLFVSPPDDAARAAIVTCHLRERPVADVDVSALVRKTDGFSGADLAHLCESAAEYAIADSLRTGELRKIDMGDLTTALTHVRSSTSAWLEAARNVALFANSSGEYDDLLHFLKARRLA